MYSKNLLTFNNAKTVKGQKKNFVTAIMYLSPFTLNSKGVNLCPHASKGCAKACLFQSGSARFDSVQLGKMNKTEFFLADRKGYMNKLFNEITKIVKTHKLIEGERYTKRMVLMY